MHAIANPLKYSDLPVLYSCRALRPSPSVTAMNLPLMALAVAAFGIGTTEFVIMGLLPEVATDLGVTIPAAGMLVSAYALGVAVGGPILAGKSVHQSWPMCLKP